jgi:hypothetical protein
MTNRAEIVRWLSESNRPFKIVEDRGFLSLMKTGRPGYYVPSASTVSRDVKLVFGRTRERIARIQEHEGLINLITDCWTITIVLDIVELPKASLVNY